ncbi:transposable element Tcb2 transposase [Trichonephila clavipes]|nr:transposable element Tcb2 transposase [Trichonephila clavipes]
MDWPAYSSDLNPIEHVWDALGRRIAACLHHPENTQQLKQMLIEEWALLPQEMLHQLVLSMRKRCEATIAVRGGVYGTSVFSICRNPRDRQFFYSSRMDYRLFDVLPSTIDDSSTHRRRTADLLMRCPTGAPNFLRSIDASAIFASRDTHDRRTFFS